MPTKAAPYKPPCKPQQRPDSTQRGYGHRWKKYRAWFFAQPGNALCRHCNPLTVVATEIDHIIAVFGPDDPLFWDQTNHQPLCKPCHSRKTATEDRVRKSYNRAASGFYKSL